VKFTEVLLIPNLLKSSPNHLIFLKLTVVEHPKCITTVTCVSNGALHGCGGVFIELRGDVVNRGIPNTTYVINFLDLIVEVVTVLLGG
jgi:hypothetical protein